MLTCRALGAAGTSIRPGADPGGTLALFTSTPLGGASGWADGNGMGRDVQVGRRRTQSESIRQLFEPSILLALNELIESLPPEQIEPEPTQPVPSDRTEKVPPE